MSDVNKVRSNAGVQYGFEDTVARQIANEAVEIANEAKAQAKAISIEGDMLIVSATIIGQTATSETDIGTPPLPEGDS